jgi:DoxX-like family
MYKVFNIIIAFIWFANGFFCKVLNLVPRHKQIVQSILQVNNATASTLTILIGISEIAMAIWILSKIKSKLNAILQIAIIGIMNALEFLLAPELLLWGKLNSVFALLLMMFIYYNEFKLNTKNKLA